MTDWYISINQETKKVVDTFMGSETDVKNRSKKLKHIKLDKSINPRCMTVEINDDTGEITIKNDETKIQKENDDIIRIKWSDLRNKRLYKLKESDWIVSISDSPLSQEKVEEWKVYRQALRDLPANTTDPENPVWPQAPTP